MIHHKISSFALQEMCHFTVSYLLISVEYHINN